MSGGGGSRRKKQCGGGRAAKKRTPHPPAVALCFVLFKGEKINAVKNNKKKKTENN